MEELEPRLLFSADSPVLAIDPRSLDADTPPPVPAITQVAAAAEIAVRDQSRDSIEQRREVVFVDASTPNYRQLIDDLMKSAEQGRKVDIIVIDSDRDGIEQITEALSRYRDLDAVHLVSHGSDGRLQIGSSQLTQDTVRRYAYVIQSWGEALKADADLLLYGCDLAGSGKGQALINDLATLTGADVAASTDLTGSNLLGGDWDLEYTVGDIETDVAFSSQAQQDWTGVLATENVRDEFDAVGYSGNNGTKDWASPWIEVNDDGTPTGGQYTVWSEPVNGLPTGLGLRIGEPDIAAVNYIQRAVDLSGATSATLTFDFRRDGLTGYAAAPNPMTLDISTNGGGSWTNLRNFSNGLDVAPTLGESIDISLYLSSDTMIRFGQDTSLVLGYIYFDNIDITYETGPPQGTAIWSGDGSSTLESNKWDGTNFTGTTFDAGIGDYNITAAAEAPTRDEIIIVGVETGGDITGAMWDGSTWNSLPAAPLGSPLANVSEDFWWGFEVAYEQQSGDAMLVWNNGTSGTNGLSYSVWNGGTWTAPATITTPLSGEPQQMRLAADPTSDEMVLVVSNDASKDYVLVWDGTTWGNAWTLDGVGGDDRTDIAVAYEQQSGTAMVVYGRTGTDAYFRTWDGVSWSGENQVNKPGAVTGDVRWVTMDAHRGSDQIVLGVVTNGDEAWASVWDGTTWEASEVLHTNLSTSTAPAVGVAFETQSGQAIATYSTNSNTVRFKTWTSGGWSGQLSVVDIGNVPNSMTLDAAPSGDDIMLTVQDSNKEVSYIHWDGTTWGTPDQLENNSGEIKNQPFLFVWDENPVAGDTLPPFVITNAGSTVVQGSTDTIEKIELEFNDDIQPSGSLKYNVTAAPANGFLAFTSAPAVPVFSFLQSDIDAGNVIYVHDDSPTASDNFTFDVDDGVGNFSSGHLFNITVLPRNLLVVTSDQDTAIANDGDTSSITKLLENMGSDGLISLREAIEAANATANLGTPDRIIFDIAGAGLHTIGLLTELPSIIDAVEIDATTQNGFGVDPIIELDGTLIPGGLENGFYLDAGSDGSTIRGFIINNLDNNGIQIDTSNNTIAGNWIGLDDDGGAGPAPGNGAVGIWLTGTASNNTIGGPTALNRNVVSGSGGSGIQLEGADNNSIVGNYIGTDSTGTLARGNLGEGMWLLNGAVGNVIGGSTPAERNVIAGNGFSAIYIGGSDNNTVSGNYLGVDSTGVNALGNGEAGVWLQDSFDNTTGGIGAGNVIGGSTWDGVIIAGAASTGNRIQGNWIGTDVSGAVNLGNSDNGIWITNNAADNLIGGAAPGAGNTIAFNSLNGIHVTDTGGDGNAILGNSIYNNTLLGIDLADDGLPTPNDPVDPDLGPNELQNYPVLAAANTDGVGSITIAGTLNSNISTTYRIEFFASPVGDPSGYGQAERYLGFTTVSTDPSGDATFVAPLSATVAAGEQVTATATVDLGGGFYGSTSEFAANFKANTPPVATDNSNPAREDITLVASGNMLTDDDGFGVDNDVDVGDILSVVDIDSVTDPGIDVIGTYGSLDWDTTGGYTYTLNNTLPAVQALNFGDSVIDTFVYTVSDGNGGFDTANLDITILGRDDISFAIASTPTINEDLSQAATFTITIGGTISSGNLGRVDIDPTGSALSGTDYDDFFSEIDAAILISPGVSRVGNTLTFDNNLGSSAKSVGGSGLG